MKRLGGWVVLAFAGAIMPGEAPAAAQDFRQTVVVTAAATPVELGTVTRAMTVITREQIGQLPVQSIADVLRLAASIDVRARGVRGVQADFSVRGASFGQMLVLVDGVRLNDPQSGHHNGDIPVPLASVERIEILYGPGSSLFGADAFGGTINVITRRSAAPSFTLQGGSFGFAGGAAQGTATRGTITETMAISANRSSGFMTDRDFATTALTSRTGIGDRSTISASFIRKAFGANNFYGGDAPSREWTNQTLLSADHRFGSAGGWRFSGRASYRTHGDHFIFDETRPALSDNSHRTHALIGSMAASRSVRTGTVTAGLETGGDWIASNNLGNHRVGRVSTFAEWRQPLGSRVQLDTGVRFDRYSEFGNSWSPSMGVGWSPVSRVRLRASAGRAFRVPTFTERYYSDPRNLGSPDIGPETSWSAEGGADLFLSRDWLLQTTVFGRADANVIDWLRPTVADRWRTYNVRDVDTRGLELSLRKAFANGSFLQAGYTALDVDAVAVTQLSKYLLDYAPHSLTAAGSFRLPGQFRVAPRLEYRRRHRSTGVTDDVIVDARIARRIGSMLDLLVDGTNLLDQRYQEIAGVAMPGAALTVSLAVGR